MASKKTKKAKRTVRKATKAAKKATKKAKKAAGKAVKKTRKAAKKAVKAVKGKTTKKKTTRPVTKKKATPKKAAKKTTKKKTAGKKATKKSTKKAVKKTSRKTAAKSTGKSTKKSTKKTTRKSTGRTVKKSPAVAAQERRATKPRVGRPAPLAAPMTMSQPPVEPQLQVVEPPAALVTPPPAPAEQLPPAVPPMPEVGAYAPDFELMDGEQRAHRLSDYVGRRVVLYFYPKDDTPGCTKEACGFRDTRPQFEGINAVVLGVSPDTIESHARFAQKYGLNFPLLADPDHAVAEQYGVWGPKNRYGRTSYGIYRTTFVIDRDGRIERVFKNVSADGHEQEVLSYLQG